MLCLLLCLSLAALTQRDPVGYGMEAFAPFDPRAWSSASGEWTLQLEPTNVEGKGPAQYVLRHGSEVAWEGERPFTLLRAAVGDRGDVVGYALVGQVARDERILLAAIDPEGAARWEVWIQRGFTGAMHAPPSPAPRAFAFDEAGDRIALRLYEYTEAYQGGTWRFYRASTGEHLGAWFGGSGAGLLPGSAPTSALERRMAAAEAEWKTEWEGLAPAPRPAPAPSTLTPVLIAEVALDRDGLTPHLPASESFGRVYFTGIDALGRLLAKDREQAAAHVWSADGTKLFVLSPSDDEAAHGIDEVIGLRDGGLVLRLEKKHCVRFDRTGARIETFDLPLEHAAFSPGRAGTWVWGLGGGPRWVPPGAGANEAEIVLGRLLDRRWIWRVDCAAPLDDGGIAVVARGELAFFGPDGTPGEMIRLATKQTLQGVRDFGSLRVVGARAVAVTWPGEALLVERESRRVQRLVLPGEPRCVGLSPDGGELWVLVDKDLLLRRYALPER